MHKQVGKHLAGRDRVYSLYNLGDLKERPSQVQILQHIRNSYFFSMFLASQICSRRFGHVFWNRTAAERSLGPSSHARYALKFFGMLNNLMILFQLLFLKDIVSLRIPTQVVVHSRNSLTKTFLLVLPNQVSDTCHFIKSVKVSY